VNVLLDAEWVRAQKLTTDELMQAIDKGRPLRFHGCRTQRRQSKGPKDHHRNSTRNPYIVKYRTQFIGNGGKVHRDRTANPAIDLIIGN